jgi:hypothetical protein
MQVGRWKLLQVALMLLSTLEMVLFQQQGVYIASVGVLVHLCAVVPTHFK